MTKKYAQLLSQGASLWTKNIRNLIPLLVFSIVSSTVVLLLSSFLLVPPAQISASWMMNLAFYVIISMSISIIIYGWTFALIEQSVLKKKFTLMGQLKPGLRKAWTQFLVLILFLLMFIGLVLVLMVGFIITELISKLLSPTLGFISIALIIVLMILFVIVAFILAAYAVQMTAVLIMEDVGAIQTLKVAWRHFKLNKKHSFALLGLFLLFLILASIPNLGASIVLFDFNDYVQIQQSPYLYASINAITSLPIVLVMFWMLYVIALAYQDRRKAPKGLKPVQKL